MTNDFTYIPDEYWIEAAKPNIRLGDFYSNGARDVHLANNLVTHADALTAMNARWNTVNSLMDLAEHRCADCVELDAVCCHEG